jgi:hypothetical protein
MIAPDARVGKGQQEAGRVAGEPMPPRLREGSEAATK